MKFGFIIIIVLSCFLNLYSQEKVDYNISLDTLFDMMLNPEYHENFTGVEKFMNKYEKYFEIEDKDDQKDWLRVDYYHSKDFFIVNDKQIKLSFHRMVDTIDNTFDKIMRVKLFYSESVTSEKLKFIDIYDDYRLFLKELSDMFYLRSDEICYNGFIYFPNGESGDIENLDLEKKFNDKSLYFLSIFTESSGEDVYTGGDNNEYIIVLNSYINDDDDAVFYFHYYPQYQKFLQLFHDSMIKNK